MKEENKQPQGEPEVRPHTYDGIQEYNHRLPNWWLATLYGSIVFFVGYWAHYEWFRDAPEGPRKLDIEMTQVEAVRMAATATANLDDKSLWAMSRNPVFVAAGRQTFEANCTACHLVSLRGKAENPAAIGPDLTDKEWIHGGLPADVYRTVTLGVPAKGMPTWGPILGPKRIAEVAAYVMSHHEEGEPVIAVPSPK